MGRALDEIRPKIAADLRDALADFVADGGSVVAPSSTWAVTARAPTVAQPAATPA